MPNAFKENSGGIRFTTPIFSFGTTTPAVNSGFSFDLPLATVQNMGNTALSFTNNNSSNNRGFLNNVIGTTSANVNATASQSFAAQNSAIDSMRWSSGAMMIAIRDALWR